MSATLNIDWRSGKHLSMARRAKESKGFLADILLFVCFCLCGRLGMKCVWYVLHAFLDLVFLAKSDFFLHHFK